MADEVQAAGVFELRAEGGDFRAEIADLTEVAKRFERATVEAFNRAGKAASDTAALEASSKRYVSAIEREALATERKTAALVLSGAEMRRAEAASRGETANAAAAIARLEASEVAYKSLASQMQRMRDINVFGDMLAKSTALGQVGKNIDNITEALERLQGEERQIAQTRVYEARVAEAAKLGMAEQYMAAYTRAGNNMVAAERTFAADTAFIDGLQRRANAIDKTQSELLELEAAQRGLTTQAAPFIAAMRAREQSFDRLGVSAGQTKAALRQLPAQFTDIFTSLQAGQAPLTVLIQQGGQIKDSFGGIGPALRGVGGAIAAAFTPVTAAVAATAAAVGTLGYAFIAGEEEAAAYRRALVLTGNAAGATAGQLQDAAAAVARSVGTQGKAAEVIAALAATGRVAGRDIGLLAEAAIRLEREGGPAIKDTVAAFAELGKSPTQGALELNETTRFLTISVLEQIRALEEQGRVTEAARVAQNAYATESISRTKELEAQLGSLEGWLRKVAEGAKAAGDAILNIGRPDTKESLFDRYTVELQRLRDAASGPTGVPRDPSEGTASAMRAKQLRELLDGLARASYEESKLAAQQKAGAGAVTEEYEKARKANERWTEAALSNSEKMNKALETYRRNLAREQSGPNPKTAAQIDREEQAIRDSFAKTNRSIKERDGVLESARDAAKAYAKAIDEAQKIEAEATGKTLELNKAQQALVGYLTSPAYLQHSDAMRSIVVQSFAAADSAIKHGDAEKARTKAMDDYTKAVVANAAEMAKNESSLESDLQRLRDEYVELTAGKEALEAQAIARLELAAAIREQAAAQALIDGGADSGLVADSLTRQAQALREQAALRRANQGARFDNELAKANEKAAADAAEEWKRTSDDIRSSLTDAFRTAFQSGEGFGTAMARTIERELKARVATALSGMLAEGVMMLLGVGDYRAGTSNGMAGGGGGLWQSASTASSLYNAGSTAYGWYSGAGTAASTYGQYVAGYQGSAAMMGAGTVGPVTNGATGATGAGASASSAMSTIGPYAIAAIAYAIGADQMADWSLHLGGYSEARRGGVRNIASEIPGSSPLDAETIAGMAEQGVYIPSVQQLSDGMATALLGFADKFATSVKAASPIEATQVVFESDRANDSWGQVKFLGAGNRELSSTGMLTDLNWDANVAAPQLVTRSATAFSTAMQDSDAAQWVKDSLAKIPAELERITPDIAKQFEDPLQQAQAVNQALVGMLDGISNTFAQLDNLDEQLGVLGGVFGQLADMSSDARYALVLAAGGMEQFQKQTSSYVSNFYTDAEKTALTLDAVGRTLSEVGLTLPATREGFRDLVDSQNLNTEAGRKAYAVLMGTADAFASVTEAAGSATNILSERTALERELLQLQGDTAELRARERAQLDESNRSLFDQIKALEDQQTAAEAAAEAAEKLAQDMANLAGAIDSNAVKFMSPEAATDYQYGTISRDLRAAGMFTDWSDFTATLKAATKDDIYAVAKQFVEMSDASVEAKIAMVEAAGALADLKDGAADAAQTVADEWASMWAAMTADLEGGVRSAYAEVAKQIDAERNRVESASDKELQRLDKQAEDVRSAFDKLAGSLGGLRDSITETIDSIYGAIAGDDGRAAARSRLAAVASGAVAVDVDAVRNDVSTASRLNPAEFATRVDFARDTARLAGLLRGVNGAVQGQIDSAQAKMARDLSAIAADASAAKLDRTRQLTALDDQLSAAREQARTLVSIDDGITSVAGALAALSSAIAALGAVRGQPTETGKWLQSGNTEVWASAAGAVGARTAGSTALADLQIKGLTANFSGQTAADFIATAAKEGRFMDIYMSAKEQGISLSDVDKLAPWAGWDDGAAERWAKANGLPVFAVGTPFVDKTGPALIHEGERIITASDNAALMRIMSGQGRDEALTAEIRALRAEVERLRAESMSGLHAVASNTGKSARLMDDVINGGESIQTRAET